MKNKKRVRKDLSTEEKILKTLQGIFILQSYQMQIKGKEIRKILNVNMNEITPIIKLITKVNKKKNK
jgi:hypothetical protein